MKIYTVLFFTLVLFVSTTCDDDVFDNRCLIDLKIKGVYPEKDSIAPVNTSVVVTFNKRIDAHKFREHMMSIVSFDGKKLDGTFHISHNTVIFTPSAVKAETKYGIHIANVIDVDGNVLKSAYSYFETGEKADLSGPFPINAKGKNNKISVYFNEPLITHALQQDSITVYNMTTGKPVNGRVSGENFSNTITFFAGSSLIFNNKYSVHVHTNKGIMDLVHNEMIDNQKIFEIYPDVCTCNIPPCGQSITGPEYNGSDDEGACGYPAI